MRKLTVAEVETIVRVWLETANASEAARQAGCNESTVRRVVARKRLPKSDDLYAQALAQEEAEHLALVTKARRKISKALDGADGDSLPDLARAVNDSLRAVSATRTAHLRATGQHAPDKHNVNLAARVVVLPEMDELDDAPGGPVASEPGPADPVSR